MSISTKHQIGGLLVASCALAAIVAAPASAAPGDMRLVARATAPSEPSLRPSASDDGRFVAFDSTGALVSGDANGRADVFVRDVTTGALVRASVGGVGGDSTNASVSNDGNSIAFVSTANGLGGAGNGHAQIYLRDLRTQRTLRLSQRLAGSRVVLGNCDSASPQITANGRFVVFASRSTDLIPPGTGTSTNCSDNPSQIYVWDRDADGNGVPDEPGGTSLHLVSIDALGAQGDADSTAPSISDNGVLVAYATAANNLGGGGRQHVVVQNRDTDTDGVFDEPGDVSTTRVDVTDLTAVPITDHTSPSIGNQPAGDPVISADGTKVAFVSRSTNLAGGFGGNDTDVFRRDLQTHQTIGISVANVSAGLLSTDAAVHPSISRDGDRVAFAALRIVATGPKPSDITERVFVRTVTGAITARVDTVGGLEANGKSSADPSISKDGRFTAFDSDATNLVAPDGNGSVRDVYEHEQ